VLSTAYVLKEQALGAIEMRHTNEQAFQAALVDWQIATAHPEEHPHWSQFYANALRDALRTANSRRQETLSQMTREDWRVCVFREMQADVWYATPDHVEIPCVAMSSDTSMLFAGRNGHSPKVIAAAE
jgi:hypothetical protein